MFPKELTTTSEKLRAITAVTLNYAIKLQISNNQTLEENSQASPEPILA